MEYRTLGRTGLKASAIGLGTEYLLGQPRETVISVVRTAIENGVNYIDMVYAFAEYRDNIGAALQGRRENAILAGHLGSAEKDGQYQRTQGLARSEQYFADLLARLGTDHVDVLLLHNFNTLKQLDRATRPKGLLELAHRLQREGQGRYLGISTHSCEVATQAIVGGYVDVLMFPINVAGHAMAGRSELLNLCVREQVGIVAMKPFAGGRLLQRGTHRIAKYQTGGDSVKLRIRSDITPVQCISYVLAQPGAPVALPGVKNSGELASALHTLMAPASDRDFSGVVAEFERYVEGQCVYCNHCLPCPVGIDIAHIHRLADQASAGLLAQARDEYASLDARASDCTQCGACVTRCPFGVDAVSTMGEACQLLEQA